MDLCTYAQVTRSVPADFEIEASSTRREESGVGFVQPSRQRRKGRIVSKRCLTVSSRQVTSQFG